MKRPKTWLLIDCHNLAYRAFYSTGDLSYDGILTGVTFGFLHEIAKLQDMFNTKHVVFCFDSPKHSLRKEFFPDYKKKRHEAERTEEEKIAFADLHRQIRALRRVLLRKIGFKNVFMQKGYESDDLIGVFVKESLKPIDTAIIVSGDKDYRQLLAPNVMQHDPKTGKLYTIQTLYKEWGISTPHTWAHMMELSGCNTDGVPGIKGVGPATAVKFLLGQLPTHHKVHATITSDEAKVIRKRNCRLTYLPYPGTKKLKLRKDVFSPKGWKSVCRKLGIRKPFGFPLMQKIH